MNTDNRNFIYHIDANDLIVYVNDHWLSFASENGNGLLTLNTVLKRPLWDFIDDKATLHVYELILLKVRKDGVTVSVPFRCDSPDCRRFMELEVSPVSGNVVQFKSRILKLEYRDPVPLLAYSIGRSDEFLSICSWCKRVKVGSEYLEVEKAVERLSLFDTHRLPRLTHGICPDCATAVGRRLKGQ